MPRSSRWRGATRVGLFNGSPVPAAGTASRLVEILPGAHAAKPAAGVAGTLPHDIPMAVCWAGVRLRRSLTSLMELATRPESYRQLSAAHEPVGLWKMYCRLVVALNFWSWSMRNEHPGASQGGDRSTP